MTRDQLAVFVVCLVTVLMLGVVIFDGFVFYKQNRHYDVPVWLVSIFTAGASGAVYWAFKRK